MSDLLLETERLRVRRLNGGDVEALLAVYGDAEAMRWVDDGQPITREECVLWVEVTQRNYEQRGYGMSAVETSPSGPPIGFCGLVHPGGQAEPELKYAFQRDHWGKGFATEAAQAMLRYGIERFGMTEVIATVAPENEASRRVLAKCGLRRSETRTDEDGSLTDVFRWRAEGAGEGPGGRADDGSAS